jgi:hypothetical protein
MGARNMNARKKKKRLAHREARQKQSAQIAASAAEPAKASRKK